MASKKKSLKDHVTNLTPPQNYRLKELLTSLAVADSIVCRATERALKAGLDRDIIDLYLQSVVGRRSLEITDPPGYERLKYVQSLLRQQGEADKKK